GGEGGRYAVAEKDERVGCVLVDPASIEQIHGVMRMEVEEARQDRLIVVQPDDLGGRHVTPVQVGADFEKESTPHDDAGVRLQRVADAVEQLAAGDDD